MVIIRRNVLYGHACALLNSKGDPVVKYLMYDYRWWYVACMGGI